VRGQLVFEIGAHVGTVLAAEHSNRQPARGGPALVLEPLDAGAQFVGFIRRAKIEGVHRETQIGQVEQAGRGLVKDGVKTGG